MPIDLIDPELRDIIPHLPQLDFPRMPLAAVRANVPMAPLLPPPAPQPAERTIPGAGGQPDVRVLVIDPQPGARDRPALLYIHGGGFVLGSVDQTAADPQRTAIDAGVLVVSVDYRLAPEMGFAGSLADTYAALCWLAGEGGRELGIDPARIAVGGPSAGGGHSAMLAIAARNRGGPKIAFQLLTYPMLDDRTGSRRQTAAHLGEHVWTADSNRFGWTSLLGQPAGEDTLPDGAIVPARLDDFAGLAPAWIGCGALDLLIEENLAYASCLIAAGVPVSVTVVAGAYHGFDMMAPAARVSRDFHAARIAALKTGLGLTG